MSKIRDLIEKIPHVSGCQDPERFAERNTMIFDLEMKDSESKFSYKNSDKTRNRLAVLEIPAEYVEKSELYRAAMDRLRIAVLSSDKEKGRITEDQETELSFLIDSAKENPEIDSVLSLEIAARGSWI